VLICLLLLCASAPVLTTSYAQGLPPVPERRKRLGINFIPPAQPWLNRARELGVWANRWQLNWQDVEPQQDHWSWDWADSEVYRMVEEGELEAHLVLALPPEWAREPGKLVPRNLYLAWDDPQNFWGRFVYRVADHYRERPVRYFEVWNEPDWDQYWQGSAADYYQLLKVAYRAIKAANPKAKVIMGGMSHWHDPTFWEQVLEAAVKDPEAPANDYFFDIVAFHWYSRSELLYDKVVWARDTLRHYGLDKPVWINEVNVPLWGVGQGPTDPQPGYATTEEQAAFILQAHANAFAAGAERVFFFRMSDDQMGEAFGLLRNDARRREAFVAYQIMSTYLADATPENRTVENGVVEISFRRGEQERITVLWNQTPQPTQATVAATRRGALLIDQDGTTRSIQPTDGIYRVTLPGATNRGDQGPNDYAIGGRTFLLVEGSGQPPVSHVEPLPELASSSTFEVRWSAEDRSGAGIASYDVQVRRGDGDWQDWLTGTTATQATFAGQDGEHYAFRVRARDSEGRVESWRDGPDAETALLGSLAGSVRDILDNPIAGAQVCLTGGECVETDQAGSFQFTARPPGVYELTTSVPPRRGNPSGLATSQAHQFVRVALGAPGWYGIHLLPTRNRIPNGDFSGAAAPYQRIEADSESNRRAVLRFSGSDQPSQRLSFVVYVGRERAQPVLAFDYMLTGAGDLFTAGVYRDLDNEFTPLVTSSRSSDGWQHRWLDLTPYRGRYIDIEFAIHRQDSSGDLTAFIDNVVVTDAGSFHLYFPHVGREK
jgi:hypothetical protein